MENLDLSGLEAQGRLGLGFPLSHRTRVFSLKAALFQADICSALSPFVLTTTLEHLAKSDWGVSLNHSDPWVPHLHKQT